MYFLHVRKGSALFQISVNLPNRMIDMMKQSQGGPEKYAALVLEMDKALAAKALPRLQRLLGTLAYRRSRRPSPGNGRPFTADPGAQRAERVAHRGDRVPL